jgi:hypothetical protein
MRKDLNPLCDRHYRPMRIDVEYVEAPREGPHWTEVYRCSEPQCPRRFTTRYGYYTAQPDFKVADVHRLACPQHRNAPMYISELRDNSAVWKCESAECSGSLVPLDDSTFARETG